MAYVTSTSLRRAVRDEIVDSFCETSDELAEAIEFAEGLVESALSASGYVDAVPASVFEVVNDMPVGVPKLIRLATVGAWMTYVHEKEGHDVDRGSLMVKTWEDLRDGHLEIPGLRVDTVRGHGGISTSPSDPLDEDVGEQVFNPKAMRGY